MKILCYIRTNSGPCYHRLQMPLVMMNDRDVMFANDFQEKHFEDIDILIYNRTIGDQFIEQIRELRKKYGFKIVVDVDDIWHLDQHHILNEAYIRNGFAAQQINQVRYADIVTTTHSRLAKYIEDFNENVYVLPNAIPKQGQFLVDREESEFIRMFWQGSITHKEDLRILTRPIEALGPISMRLQMVLGGYTRFEGNEQKTPEERKDEQEWNEMAMIYTAKAKHQYKLLPPEKVTSYYQMYKHADVCLVPLVNSFFNRMKSNLKVLEAANLALPVIASDVHPYKDLPIRYCRHPNDWIKNIADMIRFPEKRTEEGLALAEYAELNFNFHKINQERRQIFEYAIKQPA